MPARLPDAVKRARGTLRPGRVNWNAPHAARARVPKPPDGLSEPERLVWLEVGPQINALGTYTKSNFTAFRLLVRVLAMVDSAPVDMPATALVRLVQVASGLLQRFGLDPASRGRIEVAPEPRKPSALDEFADIE